MRGRGEKHSVDQHGAPAARVPWRELPEAERIKRRAAAVSSMTGMPDKKPPKRGASHG
jgi:hypothetical protein